MAHATHEINFIRGFGLMVEPVMLDLSARDDNGPVAGLKVHVRVEGEGHLGGEFVEREFTTQDDGATIFLWSPPDRQGAIHAQIIASCEGDATLALTERQPPAL